MLLNIRAIFHVCNEYFLASHLRYHCYHSCLLRKLDHLMLFFLWKCYKTLFPILSWRFLFLKINVTSKMHVLLSVTINFLSHILSKILRRFEQRNYQVFGCYLTLLDYQQDTNKVIWYISYEAEIIWKYGKK